MLMLMLMPLLATVNRDYKSGMEKNSKRKRKRTVRSLENFKRYNLILSNVLFYCYIYVYVVAIVIYLK